MREKSVLCSAGSNSGGQLGLGHNQDSHALQVCRYKETTFPPVDLKVVHLAGGSNHAIALLQHRDSGGKVQLWGSGCGSDGQLGKRNISTNTFRRLDWDLDVGLGSILQGGGGSWEPVKAACGWNSTFIAMRREGTSEEDDVIVVLGRDNDFGQLGSGNAKTLEGGVTLVHPMQSKGVKRGPMRVVDIVCGLRHTVVRCDVVEEQGQRRRWIRLYGWGAARHGQLDAILLTPPPPAVYWHPHLVDEWECAIDGEVAEECALGAGKEHTVYRLAGTLDDKRRGDLVILGSNRQGQQRVGSRIKGEVAHAACTWNATLVLVQSHQSGALEVVGSGNNTRGQLGSVEERDGIVKAALAIALEEEEGSTIERLACGSEHALVIVRGASKGEVWGWGWNEHGNLAQGDEEDRLEPVQIWPPTRGGSSDLAKTGKARQMWAGCGTTFVEIVTELGV